MSEESLRLTLKQREPCWVEIWGLGGRLMAAVRYGVKLGYRQYDNTTQIWLVHYTWLGWLVHLARSYGYSIDYASLPTTWQLRAAGAQLSGENGTSVLAESPYLKLHVLEDAPIEVVRAAYKALAQIHHPDAGGSAERFREVSDAYQAILKLRSLSA